MKIAVLSGKGGTGKTFVAVNLSSAASRAQYIDCDVEAPNGHLFFNPIEEETHVVNVKRPVVDNDKCIGCQACVEFCNFNALAYVKKGVMVFDDICHSCGGCAMVCPQHAITERDDRLGFYTIGHSENVTVVTGMMDIGKISGVPIIKALNTFHSDLTIVDCPPGSACSVIESIEDADYCILVAEPTTFGVHNLKMVYELVKGLGKPFGVVLNKCTSDHNPAETFCQSEAIAILGKIAYDPILGKLGSEGKIAVRQLTYYQLFFKGLLDKIIWEVSHETNAHS